MTNIFLVFDEEDENIGSFNQGCKEDYEKYLNSSIHDVTYIGSNTLNPLNIQLRLEKLSSFIFAAYSHGDINRLHVEGRDYISTNLNITLFSNSFFYTVSCHTGIKLGIELIKNGCQCYFGYKTLFNSWLGYIDFSECANFGFFKFLEGSSTDDIFKMMIEKYNTNLDILYKEDFLVASLLRQNRDGLIKLGNNISIDNLE